MAVKLVLILSALAQLAAAVLALRLNQMYRRRSAWILISATAILMLTRRVATLTSLWHDSAVDLADPKLWTESVITLLVSILFVAGIVLIEPLFVAAHKTEQLLKQEKRQLERVVQATQEELRLARQIQQNLFPKSSPKLNGVEIAGESKPAEWTSGDYYDYITLHDGCTAVVVADVSGHGLGPALLMSETRAFLRALAQTHSDVGQILTIANRAIAEDVEEGRFVTMVFARIDVQARTMIYTAAGHHGYLLDGNGRTRTLKPTGLPLGVAPDTVIQNAPELPLNAGDILAFLTDGIPETPSPQGDLFGVERALKVIRDHKTMAAHEIVDALFQAVQDFSANTAQRDDNTAVIIKIS